MGRLAVTLLATSLLLGAPAAARAHGHPEHADPKVGSTIAASPGEVRLWFDTDLEPASSTMAVNGPDGARVDRGDGGVDPSDRKLLRVGVLRLAPGTYRVSWNVTAKDGHRTSGQYEFTVRG